MKIIEHFFNLIAPDECIVCGHEGSLLCRTCVVTETEIIPDRCYRCYKLSPLSKTCQTCRSHSVLKYVWIRTSYTNTVRKIVHELKFSYAKSAARLIAQEIVSTLPQLPEDAIIVHVPAATSHVRQRGFDQSALIAREISKLTSLPHVHALARRGQQRQVGSSRNVRMQQMKYAFRVVSEGVIQDATVILVDDVITTGSTLEAAALALKTSGARTVCGAVFAQAK